MNKRLIIFFLLACFSKARAQVIVRPYVETVFPVHLAAGAEIAFLEKIVLGVGVGKTPDPFASFIGQVTSELGENDSYKDLIEAAFEENVLLRLHSSYYFNNIDLGWSINLGFSYIDTSGSADIDTVLTGATGSTFPTLTTLLTNAGKSTTVDLESNISVLDINGGYSFKIYEKFVLKLSLGISKVLSAQSEISTGLANYEASELGQSQLSNAEDEIEQIVKDYGIIPTVGVNFTYNF